MFGCLPLLGGKRLNDSATCLLSLTVCITLLPSFAQEHRQVAILPAFFYLNSKPDFLHRVPNYAPI
jgi:hypothetical protein